MFEIATLSICAFALAFASGTVAATFAEVKVACPSGKHETLGGVKADQFPEIREPEK